MQSAIEENSKSERVRERERDSAGERKRSCIRMAALHALHLGLPPAPPASSPFRPSAVPTPSRHLLLQRPKRSLAPIAACSMDHIASYALESLPLAVMDTGSGINNLGIGFALASGGLIAVLAAALSLADPEKRRQQQTATVGGNEKDAVRSYFNTSGFDRWKRIYGEADDVNNVQLDIRKGHAETMEKVLGILKKGGLEGITVCDAGCGTGSLTVPLVLEGAIVNASDISSAMVSETKRVATEAINEASDSGKRLTPPSCEAKDLESLQGKYHTVTCIDVLIHYPQEKAAGMIAHLASLAENRLILSFAPKTPFSVVLKRIGEFFPGPSKATRAYLHAEADVEAALNAAGWVVRSREMTSTKFYYSRLLEAVPSGTSA